jgi:hypothetical protein
MGWVDLDERVAAVSKFDASVRLLQRSASSKPALLISLRKGVMGGLKWKPSDMFGLALGRDDNSGKVRIIRRKDKTKAIAAPRQMKTGSLSFDFGHVASFGERGTLKAEAVAVIIDADTVEVTIPKFEYEDEVAEDNEEEEPEAAPAPKQLPAPARPPVAAPAPEIQRRGVTKDNGIEIDDRKDAEHITYRGKTMEITLRQAIFLSALAKAMPQAVDRNFLTSRIFGARPPTTASMVLDQINMDLSKALPEIGLQIKNIKGVGFALQEAA